MRTADIIIPPTLVEFIRAAGDGDAAALLHIIRAATLRQLDNEPATELPPSLRLLYAPIAAEIDAHLAACEAKSQQARAAITARWKKHTDEYGRMRTNTDVYGCIKNDTDESKNIRTNTNEYGRIKKEETKNENKEKEISPRTPFIEKEKKEKRKEERDSPAFGAKADTSAAQIAVNCDSDFATFWEAYGKKRDRPCAFRAWLKAKKDTRDPLPPLADLLAIVAKWRDSYEWRKDDGQFQPYPATWLNRRGWLDELPADVAENQQTENETPAATIAAILGE